jgi:hypothetical protein
VEGPPLDLDEWHYAVVRVDRVDDTVSVQLDGVPVGEDTIDADTNGIGHNLTVGGEHAGEFLFDGVIDEARISSVLRSEDWVLFQNVATRDELFEYGAVESL